MVLHDRRPRRPMTDFGIQIPILGSNPDRTIESLRSNPAIASPESSWLRLESFQPLTKEEILRVHDEDYVNRLLAHPEGIDGPCEEEIARTFELRNEDGSFHRFDPESAKAGLCELRDQSLRLAAGTTVGARLACELPDRFVFFLGGGMHHGQYAYGEGFCLVNDLMIAVRALQAEKLIDTAWIIDVDAHKGDGTAALASSDDSIQTMSVHMAAGWPMDQPRVFNTGEPNPSFVPSTIDVPIAEGEEAQYVPRMIAALDQLEATFPPPDFVLVVDGADPYERDQLPSAELLKMTKEQLYQRDAYLYRWTRRLGAATLFVMAGNYGYHSWEIYSQFLADQIGGVLED
jgi:acetoin utilization deacetylase AcuC-like enzyme